MRNTITVLLAVGLIVLSVFMFVSNKPGVRMGDAVLPSTTTETPDTATATTSAVTETPVAPTPVLPIMSEEREAGLNEVIILDAVAIKLVELIEDSRCPSDVVCVQVGTVRLAVEVVTGGRMLEEVVTLNEKKTIAGFDVTLTTVTPYPRMSVPRPENEYRFSFTVVKAPAVPVAKCFIGGCSSQICSDSPDVVTDCMYREEYACYQTAVCERQASGSCGWTETPALTSCLQQF
jgi:hypothetical protein